MTDTITSRPVTREHSYADAVEHYSSTSRRDAVKRLWEEPFSKNVYGDAIARLGAPTPLRVLDVGCGTGDGLRLLRTLSDERPWLVEPSKLRYVGLDNDQEMISCARQRFGGDSGASFARGDMRQDLPNEPFDFYLSCGVPYSHLTAEELCATLAAVFGSVREFGTRSAVVVDVLGRYSIEWVDRWTQERWRYRMSFFSTDAEMGGTEMSFYGAARLSELIQEAARDAICAIEGLSFFDRSITVGRHTATREFNPGIEPYRLLLNSLYDGSTVTPLEDLLLDTAAGVAPAQVLRFHAGFTRRWNEIVHAAIRLAERPSADDPSRFGPTAEPFVAAVTQHITTPQADDFRAAILEPTLAEALRHLEQKSQPGLGVGHSLIAVVLVDGGR